MKTLLNAAQTLILSFYGETWWSQTPRQTGAGTLRRQEREAREKREREMFGAPALGVVNNKAVRGTPKFYAERATA